MEDGDKLVGRKRKHKRRSFGECIVGLHNSHSMKLGKVVVVVRAGDLVVTKVWGL